MDKVRHSQLFFLSVVGQEEYTPILLRSPSAMTEAEYTTLCDKVREEELAKMKAMKDFLTTDDLQEAMVDRLCKEFRFEELESIEYRMDSAILQDREWDRHWTRREKGLPLL